MATAAPALSEDALRERLENDTQFYCEVTGVTITPKQGGLKIPLIPNDGQIYLEEKLREQREAGLPQRAVILKSRQVGFSTIAQAKLIQRCTTRRNHQALVIAQDKKTGKKLFRIGFGIYASLPEDEMIAGHPLKPGTRRSREGQHLHFAQDDHESWRRGELWPDSEYDVDTASESDAGRGGTFQSQHWCFPDDTPILCGDGRLKRPSEIEPGEPIVTHTGALATVRATASRPNKDEMIVIRPWLGSEIRVTGNHEVWVRPGEWKRADRLTPSDQVSMPIRPITTERSSLPTRPSTRVGQTGGAMAKGGGEPIPLNEDTGFTVGYYLAEGCIIGGRYKTPGGITFTRDQGEKEYADRAIAPLEPWMTSRRTSTRTNSRTVQDTIYGSAFAAAISREFGEKDEKRIPDWVFEAGENFCRGLLLGYLSGDGSKCAHGGKGAKYDSPLVAATSIRESLVTQARDIAASLGYGWASLTYRPASDQGGRNAQEAWVVRWSGDAARRLRADLDLEAAPTKGKPFLQKAEISDGFVWIKIRELRVEEPASEVWDLEVEHSDHSFRTAHFSIKNSEVAMWENPEDKVAALLDTVPDDPDSLIIAESTARGHNYFKDMWDAAVAGESGFVPVFWAWHQHAEYQLPFISEQERERFVIGDHRWGEDEPEMVERFGLTKEQLNWRRSKIARYGNDIATFNQEHPTTPELAFIGTGSRVFDGQTVSVLIEKCLAEDPPARGALRQSRSETEVGRGGKTVQVPAGPVFVPHGDLAAASAPWMFFTEFEDEQPKIPEGGQYMIGVDMSGGEMEEGGKEPAMHAIEVVDHVTGEQMAEYASRIDPFLVTEQIYLAALMFNNAWVVVERTGGWGVGALNTLWKDFHYSKVYRKKRQGTPSEKAEKVLGWNTDQNTKALLISNAQSLLNGEITGIHSATLAREMLTYIRDENGGMKPEPGKFSDRLMAWMFAQQVRFEIPAIAPDSDRIRTTFRAADPITGY